MASFLAAGDEIRLEKVSDVSAGEASHKVLRRLHLDLRHGGLCFFKGSCMIRIGLDS